MKDLTNSVTLTVEITLESGDILVGSATYNVKHCYYNLISPVQKQLGFSQLMYGIPVVYYDPELGIKPHDTSGVDVRTALSKKMMHYWENRESIDLKEQRIVQFWIDFEQNQAREIAEEYFPSFITFQEERAVLNKQCKAMNEIAQAYEKGRDEWFKTEGREIHNLYNERKKSFNQKLGSYHRSIGYSAMNVIPDEIDKNSRTEERAKKVILKILNDLQK